MLILIRYPQKAAKYLEMTLKKNRTMLKTLQTNVSKKDVVDPGTDVDNVEVEGNLKQAADAIEFCRCVSGWYFSGRDFHEIFVIKSVFKSRINIKTSFISICYCKTKIGVNVSTVT